MQSFIDELAHAAGKDPVQFRLDLLGNTPRRAAADGGRRLRRGAHARRARAGRARSPAGESRRCRRARAWASRSTSATAATSPKWCRRRSSKDGTVKVDKVWVVGDIGSQIINPSDAENQAQGAVLDGIAEALGQEITIDNGPRGAEQLQRRSRCCACARRRRSRCTSASRRTPPTGLGEPALPPVVPALCNAIFMATGKRVRSLPLSKQDLKWS